MRFVFLSHNYTPGVSSPEEWVERVKIYAGSLEILSKYHEIIRVEQISYEGKFHHNGIEYLFVNYRRRKSYVPFRLHRLVKSLKPDIIVVHGLHYPLQTMQLRMHLGRKPLLLVQNHAEKPFTGFKKYLQRLADHFTDGYLFASAGIGMDWVRRGNLGSEKKVHEVMEVSSVFKQLDKKEARSRTGTRGQPVYIWVGRLDKNKDPLTVVKAFLEFTRLHPLAKLFMIFHTEELLPEIRELLARNTTWEDAVFLVGKLPHEELLYWYNSADFVISGSHFEGSGTAICEAMSCGCVPVVTDIFSFRMMTGNGKCGLLYKAGSVPDLLTALKRTLSLDMENERAKTLAQFRQKLSFEAIAGKFQEIANSL